MSSSSDINVPLELALAAGSAVASCVLYFAAGICYSKYDDSSIAYSKLSRARIVPISGLRSLLSSDEAGYRPGSESSKEMLVLVRGVIKATSENSKCNVLLSTPEGERISSFTKSPFILKESGMFNHVLERISSFTKIPFICNNVVVDSEGSSHLLPLKVFNIYSRIITSGPRFRVGEQIYPVGMEISALGMCSLQDGKLQIKACEELPYFTDELTRNQMVKFLNDLRQIFIMLSIILMLYSGSFLFEHCFGRIYLVWKIRRQERKKNKGR